MHDDTVVMLGEGEAPALGSGKTGNQQMFSDLPAKGDLRSEHE
jgi:hypothetical protein